LFKQVAAVIQHAATTVATVAANVADAPYAADAAAAAAASDIGCCCQLLCRDQTLQLAHLGTVPHSHPAIKTGRSTGWPTATAAAPSTTPEPQCMRPKLYPLDCP